MSTFLLSFNAATTITGGTAPTLEVLIGGVVVSSLTMVGGATSYDVLVDYTGSAPSSVSLRFAGASGSPGDSISFSAVSINNTALNIVTDLTSTILMQAQASAVTTANDTYGHVTPTLGATTISGTASDDGSIGGTNGADTVDALAGNDWVFGRGGNDEINGGTGADYLFGEAGNDTILGGAGDDVLFGNDGDDVLYGEADNDFLIGGDGSDLLNGGAGNDGITGDAGDDVIFGEAGDDWILGDAGDDLLFGDDGNDQLIGGIGNDAIAGGIGDDQLVGGTGNDLLAGGDGVDQILGEDGNDTVSGGAGDDTIFGGDGNDILAGGDDSDYVSGGDGTDTLSGDAGNDVVIGGAGADTIDGDAGNDVIHGHGLDAETISDILFNNPNVTYSQETGSFYQFVNANVNYVTATAAATAATLNGTAGHLVTITSAAENTLVSSIVTDNAWHAATDDAVDTQWIWEVGAETGAQFSSGATAVNNFYENWSGGQPQNNTEHNAAIHTDGSWHDWADTATHSYVIEWEGGLFSDDNAIDTINGGSGDDQIYGWGGADILNGGSDNDTIFGGAGGDTINGDAGNDTLLGGAGVDVIDGGSGDDNIVGGDGDDTLNGGADDDTIIDASGDNVLNGDGGNDTLDTRLASTGQTSLQDQIDAILAANANLTYSAVTGNFYDHVSTGANLTWTAASNAAAANTVNGVAGHLATVTSSGENDVLVGLYDSTNSWIGGTDTGTEGVWQWVEGPEAGMTFWNGGTAGSGGSAPPGVYANFDPSQPNDSVGNQDYLYYLNNNDQWADGLHIGGSGFVNITSYFIEWEGSLLLTPPTATSGANELNGGDGADTLYSGAQESVDAAVQAILDANAGVSYSSETNSFYQFVNNNVSWNAAETAANGATLTGLTGVNGHLGTITSQAENDFIGTIIGNTTAWTAGSDVATEGTWLWTAGPEAGMQFWAGDQTGAAVNGHYENWTANEPSNGNAAWDYAKYLAADDWWADQGNDGYIIEWEADTLLASVNKTTLYGGDGADTLYASDDGIDVALFMSGDTGVDVINDFEANERDAIDISDLLTGYSYTTSAIDDFVRVTESGGNSTISVDGNGGAGGTYTDIVTLNGVTGIDLYQWIAADNLIVV